MKDEFELEESILSQSITSDGRTVQVDIYRLVSELTWALEVVDEHGNSTVWEETFDDDASALAEVKLAIAEDGIESLIGPESGSGDWL
jgi:hypothetical protein